MSALYAIIYCVILRLTMFASKMLALRRKLSEDLHNAIGAERWFGSILIEQQILHSLDL
jgi:hypothetical protein